MTNDGKPGEYAVDAAANPDPTGAGRFATDVWGDRPDLVLLLEGVNDTSLGFRRPDQIANDLGRMVRTAKNSSVKVILATLTPVGPGSSKDPAFIAAVNVEIRKVAESEAVPLVDFEQAFGSNYASLFTTDGLHPNDKGYALMAQTFFNKIVSTFQILK